MNKLTSISFLTAVLATGCLNQADEHVDQNSDSGLPQPLVDAAVDGSVTEPGPGGTHTRIALLVRFFDRDDNELTCREVVDQGYELHARQVGFDGTEPLPDPALFNCWEQLHDNPNMRWFSAVYVYDHPYTKMVAISIDGSSVEHIQAVDPKEHEFGAAHHFLSITVPTKP